MKTSLKDAYSCLWRFKWQHLFISYLAFLPFTLAGILGMLDPFFLPRSSYEIVPDGFNLSFIIFITTTYLWSIPCIILWHRLYLLGPENLLRKKIWPILTRSFVIISKVLFLIGICVFVALIMLFVAAYLLELFQVNNEIPSFVELSDNEFLRYFIVVFITGLIAYLTFLRFSLAVCARTIGKRVGLRASWQLTEKNTIRMFISFMAIFIPASTIALGLVHLYQNAININLFFSGEMLAISSYLHIFVLAPIITLPLSAMTSQCASFYRHCGGEDCDQY